MNIIEIILKAIKDNISIVANIISCLAVLAMYDIYRKTIRDMYKIQKEEYRQKKEEREIHKKEILLHCFMGFLCHAIYQDHSIVKIYNANKETIWDHLNVIYRDLDIPAKTFGIPDDKGFTVKEFIEEKIICGWIGLNSIENIKEIDNAVRQYYGLKELDIL